VKNSGKICSINISRKKGGRKHPVQQAVINGMGIEGDGHSGNWHRQVSLLANEEIEKFNLECGRSVKDFKPVKPGDFGENITTEGIDLKRLKLSGIIRVGEAVLEVTQLGKECPKPCSIYYRIGSCIMPAWGIFCRVISGGKIEKGSEISREI